MSATIAPSQRFSRRNPCPICNGGYDDLRGRRTRCIGFLSDGGDVAYCSREEHAGALAQDGPQGTFRHQLAGRCACGRTHGANAGQRAAVPRRAEPAPQAPKWRTGPRPQVLADMPGYRLAAEFVYQHADGSPSYSVLRYERPLQPGEAKRAKTFRQVRWRDDGKAWARGMGGETARVLYRGPELHTAPTSRPVFIVEGEKCVEALAALGLVATTCSEGAGKWQQVPARREMLRGRHGVILGDHDEAGRAHAEAVAADLHGCAASVRVVELPGLAARGDVVDWLASGNTKDELYELVIATPPVVHVPAAAAAPTPAPSSASPAPTPAPPVPPAVSADELRRREEALRTANARRRELEAQEAWRKACLANAELAATTRNVAIAVRDELAREKVGEGGKLKVWLPKLAKLAGVSAQTAGDALKKLAEAGAIARRVETEIGAGGRKVSRVTISPMAVFASPSSWKPPVPRNHGGKRSCPHCGGTTFKVRRTVTCAECGTIIEHEERIVAESGADADEKRLDGLFTGSQFDLHIPGGSENAGAA